MIETYQPLYLKYRPQSLSDLVGQTSVAQTLTNAIANNRISHAYLFTGPRGCGKTSSARILAKSLNCEKGPTAEPCQTCTSCIEVKSGVSPSVIEIDAASNNSVDDARMLIERAPLVAQGGRFKLYIIDECHMLTKEAFNALLKTIEEPPDKVIFILATTEEHKVPPTIVSRCQRLMFRLINQADLGVHLKNISAKENILIDDDALGLVARRSGGGLRDALGLLDQASLLATPPQSVAVTDLLALLGAVHEDLLVEISNGVLNRDGHAVLTSIHSLMGEGREPAVLTLELAKHFLSLAKAGYVQAGGSLTAEGLQALVLGSQKYLQALIGQAPKFESGELAQIVEYLDKLEQTIRRSSQPALNLEMGLLSLCHRHDIRLVREMDERLRKLESETGENPIVRPSGAPATSRPMQHAPQPTYQSPQPTYQAPQPEYQATAPAAAPRPAAPAAAIAPPNSSSRPNQEVLEGEEPGSEGLSGAETRNDKAQRAASPVPPAPVYETAGTAAKAPAPTPPRPAAPAAASASTEEPSRGNTDIVEMEEFWSNLMEALKQRNVPAFSIVHQYGFPISYDRKELVVGVKETFQNSLQNKVEHIQRAALAVNGTEILVRIKPMSQPAPQRPAQARDKNTKTAPQNGAAPEAAEEPEGAHASNRVGQGNAGRNPASSSGSADPGSSSGAGAQPANAASPVRVRYEEPSLEQGDSTLFTEAYRLFEGPGSRVVG